MIMDNTPHANNFISDIPDRPPLVILTGPTAVGKTALSVNLAKKIGGEIVSADSMQVYRRMDIGSAKVTKEEMQGVPHYLIDEFEPDEEFHVVKFQEYAKRYIQEIQSRGKIPILVGGTGFYIQAVLYDIDFTENGGDMTYRRFLEDLAHTHRVLTFCTKCCGKSILLPQMPFTKTTSNALSVRWNFTMRPVRRSLITTKQNGRKHRPIILLTSY